MSSGCQHVFCLECISTALSLSPTCPIDRSRLSLDDLVPAPRIIQQMVQELKVICPYAKHGCTVVCERSLLPNHLKRECSHKGKGKQTEDSDEEVVRRCADCDQVVKLSQSTVRPAFIPHDNAILTVLAREAPRDVLGTSDNMRILHRTTPAPLSPSRPSPPLPDGPDTLSPRLARLHRPSPA